MKVLTASSDRSLLFDRIQHGIHSARRQRRRLAVMSVGLERFGEIVDRHGQAVADRLRQAMERRVGDSLRGTDTVASSDGDGFVVVLENLQGATDAAGVAANLIDVLLLPEDLAGQVLQVGASIGIALAPEDGDSANELMAHAEAALTSARQEGSGGFRFFQAAMTDHARERLRLESELRQAVANGELEVHYQPQFTLDTRRPCGIEALVRWRHPRRGLLLPRDFIPLAEETGVIHSLGDWVLAEVCRQLAAWQGSGIDLMRVAVNVSGSQLRDGNLPERIVELTGIFGIRPASLQVEVAEGHFMADPEKSGEALGRLRAIGVAVAMDEFGTGPSGFSALRRLLVDGLKIDRSFVARAVADQVDALLVRTMVNLAQGLGLSVVAEGVETQGQADFLRLAGCPAAQGFLFRHPEPAQSIGPWLAGSWN